MKSIQSIFYILFIIVAGLTSCSDDDALDGLLTGKYVRISKSSITVSVGESVRITSIYDSDETAARKFKWSVLDNSMATVTTREDNSGIITGVGEGSTVIKVESEDGKLMHFADLNVQKERVVKILAIGNSFSEDAVEGYLHELISTETTNRVIIANLYLNASSLETHWQNAEARSAVYELRKIGTNGGLNREAEFTLGNAITDENWDYISLQEASHLAGVATGYSEYLTKLTGYIRSLATNPEMKLLLHQTWAYTEGSAQEGFELYERNQMKMYEAIAEATSEAAKLDGIDGIIPVGTAIQNGRTTYKRKALTLDDSRLTPLMGKFVVACTWFETLFGDVQQISFLPSDISEYDASLVKTAAEEAIRNPYEITTLDDYLYPEYHNEFVLEKPIFIDFGHVVAGAPFNHYGNPRDPRLTGLTDEAGTNTGFALGVDYGFADITLERDLPNTLGFPWMASNDMFFADGIYVDRSAMTLSNLNMTRKYTLIFYGGINDTSTQTEFHVAGNNEGRGAVVNDFNQSNLVLIRDIIPADDATITITLRPGPENIQWAKFYGVNVMIIAPEGYEGF